LFSGFYKVDYQVANIVGRSVMYVHDGKMLGGNSAFAHIGSYTEDNGVITTTVAGQRHHADPSFPTLYGSDTTVVIARGTADGQVWRFEGTPTDAPGPLLRSVMTPLDEQSLPPPGTIGDGAIHNGLYALNLKMLDGVDGGLTGVMLLHDGRILGGDAYFYYLGSYASANGRWRGQILNQEHTPALSAHPLFGGHDVGIGFSGSCDDSGAELEASAFVGKRSLRLKADLKLLHRS
jgi:hypothetical protein